MHSLYPVFIHPSLIYVILIHQSFSYMHRSASSYSDVSVFIASMRVQPLFAAAKEQFGKAPLYFPYPRYPNLKI
jgi:hypothetical protein